MRRLLAASVLTQTNLRVQLSERNRAQLWPRYSVALYAELQTVAERNEAQRSREQQALYALCLATARLAGGR